MLRSSRRYIANSPCPEIRGQDHYVATGERWLYGLTPRTKNGPALAGYRAIAMANALRRTVTTLPVGTGSKAPTTECALTQQTDTSPQSQGSKASRLHDLMCVETRQGHMNSAYHLPRLFA
ncbi:hypothetical protein GFK26_18940 [Variovorax paradoxus]|uniref:Uncharacterized protein n=1 Tax=Variovorax paradoxus TaxID=34073 RepID=A0A5Q0M7A5_VARPD|nr:hypothetical protein GFK26_18940 [Variovorax paradoxus]